MTAKDKTKKVTQEQEVFLLPEEIWGYFVKDAEGHCFINDKEKLDKYILEERERFAALFKKRCHLKDMPALKHSSLADNPPLLAHYSVFHENVVNNHYNEELKQLFWQAVKDALYPPTIKTLHTLTTSAEKAQGIIQEKLQEFHITQKRPITTQSDSPRTRSNLQLLPPQKDEGVTIQTGEISLPSLPQRTCHYVLTVAKNNTELYPPDILNLPHLLVNYLIPETDTLTSEQKKQRAELYNHFQRFFNKRRPISEKELKGFLTNIFVKLLKNSTRNVQDATDYLLPYLENRYTVDEIPHSVVFKLLIQQISPLLPQAFLGQHPLRLSNATDPSVAHAFLLFCEIYGIKAENHSSYQDIIITKEQIKAAKKLFIENEELSKLQDQFKTDEQKDAEKSAAIKTITDFFSELKLPANLETYKLKEYVFRLTPPHLSVKGLQTVVEELKIAPNAEQFAKDCFLQKRVTLLTEQKLVPELKAIGLHLTRQQINDILKKDHQPALGHIMLLTRPNRWGIKKEAIAKAFYDLGLTATADDFANPYVNLLWRAKHPLLAPFQFNKTEAKNLIFLGDEAFAHPPVSIESTPGKETSWNSPEELEWTGRKTSLQILGDTNNLFQMGKHVFFSVTASIQKFNTEMSSSYGKVFDVPFIAESKLPKTTPQEILLAAVDHSPKNIFLTMPSIRGPADLWSCLAIFPILNIGYAYFSTAAQLATDMLASVLTKPTRWAIDKAQQHLMSDKTTRFTDKLYRAGYIAVAALTSPLWVAAQALYTTGKLLAYSRRISDSVSNLFVIGIAKLTHDKTPYPPIKRCLTQIFRDTVRLVTACIPPIISRVNHTFHEYDRKRAKEENMQAQIELEIAERKQIKAAHKRPKHHPPQKTHASFSPQGAPYSSSPEAIPSLSLSPKEKKEEDFHTIIPAQSANPVKMEPSVDADSSAPDKRSNSFSS